jgi:hypothetical protein
VTTASGPSVVDGVVYVGYGIISANAGVKAFAAALTVKGPRADPGAGEFFVPKNFAGVSFVTGVPSGRRRAELDSGAELQPDRDRALRRVGQR